MNVIVQDLVKWWLEIKDGLSSWISIHLVQITFGYLYEKKMMLSYQILIHVTLVMSMFTT